MPDHRGLLLGTVLGALVLGGCGAPRRASTLLLADFDAATHAMVQSLGRSAFLTHRTPASPPCVIVIDKVENLTSDIIPPAEQWMLMARLQGALPVLELARTRNIRFVIPPERELLARQGGYQGPLASATRPTHVLQAVFRSATRLGTEESSGRPQGRTDYYRLQYQLTDLASRELVWADEFEFKRQAPGLLID